MKKETQLNNNNKKALIVKKLLEMSISFRYIRKLYTNFRTLVRRLGIGRIDSDLSSICGR